MFNEKTMELSSSWAFWTREEQRRGIHPDFVRDELVRRGLQPLKCPYQMKILFSKNEEHSNIQRRPFDIWRAILQNEITIITWFIHGGFHINKRWIKAPTSSYENFTALQLACHFGYLPVVTFLLTRPGVDIEACNAYGRTALLLAASQGHASTVNVLMKNKAHLLHTDNIGNTALHCAASGGHASVRNLFFIKNI